MPEKCEHWKAGENKYYYCHQPEWQGHKYGCYYRSGGQENCPNFKLRED